MENRNPPLKSDWLFFVEEDELGRRRDDANHQGGSRPPRGWWAAMRRLACRVEDLYAEVTSQRQKIEQLQQQSEKRPPEYYADPDEFKRDLEAAFRTCWREYDPINAHNVGKHMEVRISANTLVKRLHRHGYLKPGEKPSAVLKRLAEPFRGKHGLFSLLSSVIVVKICCMLMRAGELAEFRRMLNDL